MTWELLKPPTISVTTRIAIASIAEVLLCQFGSKGPGITECLLICLNTSRCVFCRNSPKKGEQRFVVFLLKSVCKHVSYSIIFIEAAVNISPLFKVVESYFIKLVWTFHLYFFHRGVLYLCFPPGYLVSLGISKGAHLTQAFFQASVNLTAFFADQCPFWESIWW